MVMVMVRVMVMVMVTSLDLFKEADKSDLRLSADLHRTDYPEGVRQSSADSELRREYRYKRTRRGGGKEGGERGRGLYCL